MRNIRVGECLGFLTHNSYHWSHTLMRPPGLIAGIWWVGRNQTKDQLNHLKHWSDPTVMVIDSLFLRKVLKIRTWNVDTILIQVYNLCYWNLWSKSLWIWRLCAFRHHSHFRNFQKFFIITFDWKGNFKLWWCHLKDRVQIHHSRPHLNFFYLGEKI